MKRIRAAIVLAAMLIVLALSTVEAQAGCHSPCPKPFNCLQVCGPDLK